MKETNPTINEVILMGGIAAMHNCVACGEICGCGEDTACTCIGCEDCVIWYLGHSVQPPKNP